LEDVISPFIRDGRLFHSIIWLLHREDTKYQSEFRQRAAYLSDQEYEQNYPTFPGLDSETDCNQACRDKILESVTGASVLDVGCGRGFAANLIQTTKQIETTSTDFIINEAATGRFPNCRFVSSKIETLPFDDHCCDTVVCTHTLAHTLDLPAAMRGLRRVTCKRLMIVVPQEREYRYSLNLHLHFFPYPHSFLKHLPPLPPAHKCDLVDADNFYVEDLT
jgi:SAM-dependent methyltransferase